jgi:hypothetical protein
MAATKPMIPVVPLSKDAYDVVVKNAETQYKMDRDACSSRSGNAKDIYLAEASGNEKCDAFAGPTKSACISDAKVQYGKS